MHLVSSVSPLGQKTESEFGRFELRLLPTMGLFVMLYIFESVCFSNKFFIQTYTIAPHFMQSRKYEVYIAPLFSVIALGSCLQSSKGDPG